MGLPSLHDRRPVLSNLLCVVARHLPSSCPTELSRLAKESQKSRWLFQVALSDLLGKVALHGCFYKHLAVSQRCLCPLSKVYSALHLPD
jgi:hypothetical protein